MNKILTRKERATEDSWDLRAMFPNQSAWKKAFLEAENHLGNLPDYAGRLAESPLILAQAIKIWLELMRNLDQIYGYSSLLSDQDTSNCENLGLKSQALDLYTRFSAASSFLQPELLSLDSKTIDTFLEDKVLEDYHRLIAEIIRFKPHTLSSAEEKLLASAGDIFRTSQSIFSQLSNADYQFEPVMIAGKKMPLTHGTFVTYLRNPERSIREQAWKNFYKTIANHQNSLAAMLSSNIKKDFYLASARGFKTSLQASLFADNIPVSVYDSLIDNVSKNLGPLHTYYKLRKNVLGLEDLQLYDSYCPVVENIKTEIPYKKACELILASLEPLGDEYVQTLKKGLGEARWVDRYENKGKRSGAYARPCYSDQQYILMNYKETELGDLFTLAHEAGHAMHSWFSQKHQKYQDSSYTIFVAEVASTFNEQLLLHHLKKVYQGNEKMLRFLTNHQLDDIKGTFFRQTMFAEFEKETHQLEAEGNPLTRDVFCKLYNNLLRKYFGPAMNIGPEAELECFRIPHFYSAFYVYQYATGLSAATTLSKSVMGGDPKAREQYLKFLSSGCSQYSLELLSEAGVDMLSSKPVVETSSLFNSLVKELETLIL